MNDVQPTTNPEEVQTPVVPGSEEPMIPEEDAPAPETMPDTEDAPAA